MNDKFDPEIIGKDTRFSATNQPENAGRKKNVWKHLHDKFVLSSNDVSAIIKNLSSMSKEEIEELTKKPETTMLELAYISAYIQCVKKGTLSELETMLNRVIGKVKDTQEIGGTININVKYDDSEDNNTTEDTKAPEDLGS
jgi:predicted RecB family endonuclease